MTDLKNDIEIKTIKRAVEIANRPGVEIYICAAGSYQYFKAYKNDFISTLKHNANRQETDRLIDYSGNPVTLRLSTDNQLWADFSA